MRYHPLLFLAILVIGVCPVVRGGARAGDTGYPPTPTAVVEALLGEDARAGEKRETVVYHVVRRRARWLVASPQLQPHVSLDVATRILDGLASNELVAADPERIAASRIVLAGLAAKPPVR